MMRQAPHMNKRLYSGQTYLSYVPLPLAEPLGSIWNQSHKWL